MNMKNEGNQKLLPEGWRQFEIVDCVLFTSKKNNETFKITVSDCQTYQQKELYAVATEGKRWFLRDILQACSIPAENDEYKWEEKDIIGKIINGKVENVKEKYITQYGEEIENTKSKIVEVRTIDAPQKTGEDIFPF